jgi:hypothetical protein
MSAGRVCSVEGCDRPAKARGWCGTHYSRWQRHGDLELRSQKGTRRALRKDDREASAALGHDRALRWFGLGTCEYEGCDQPAQDRHHVDDNPVNNDPANVRLLCRRHHMLIDGRLHSFRDAKGGRRDEPLPPKHCRICGRLFKPLRKGRCERCDNYFRRHGRERPTDLGAR